MNQKKCFDFVNNTKKVKYKICFKSLKMIQENRN